MIPESSNRLLISEDWTKIYKSFKNADFKSYDFETIRRVMISYLQENYPEDFNDYIESSEYVALIDLIAFLGQNLSFRIDLNARENFIETAQRRDSILRLAQLISYNPSRNVPASGLLKIVSVATTDNVIDANGINLADTTINWNDPSNPDWYQQFINILNSALNLNFGKSDLVKIINGVSTELYKFNSNNPDVPIYNFNKSISSTNMTFEVVSANFEDQNDIYEQSPRPGNSFNILYRNDNQGAGSANTGFFCLFKQGTLSLANFNVSNPVPNEIIGINTPNINNTDVWLWQLNKSGNYETYWTKVDSTVGNNVIYNSVDKSVRKIYSVSSRTDDQIDLNFADGVFGDLPNGEFRLFYRQSNGLDYVIKPEQLSGIVISVPYFNVNNQAHTIQLTLSLQYTVSNSTGSEANTSIQSKAPQTYYLQNRMITGEDYNIAPLNAGSDILKVKSINRVSSGISKYFELSDVSGKYSKTNIFASDGIIYKQPNEYRFDFSVVSRNQVFSVVKNTLSTIVDDTKIKSFYYENYSRPELISLNLKWNEVNKTPGQSRGYFYNNNGSYQVGEDYTDSHLRYIKPGAKIKFVAPEGKYFDENNNLLQLAETDSLGFDILEFVNKAKGTYSFKQYYVKTLNILPLYTGNSPYSTTLGTRYGLYRDPDYTGLKYWVDECLQKNLTIESADFLTAFFTAAESYYNTTRHLQASKSYLSVSQAVGAYTNLLVSIPDGGTSYIWATVIQVINDGASVLDDGTGPIILSTRIPSDAIPSEVITRYANTLGYAIENEIVNFCMNYKNFGLTINNITRSWEFILNSNLNLTDPFSFNNQENTADQNLDSSWLVSFYWDGKKYTIKARNLDYVFESEKETAFYVDNSSLNYDYQDNTIIKDKIEVLPINLKSSGQRNTSIGSNHLWQIDDVVIENDGYIDNKKVYISFYNYNNIGEIQNPDSFDEIVEGKYVYFEKSSDDKSATLSRQSFIELETENDLTNEMKIDGQLFYFYRKDIDVVKYWSASSSSLIYTDRYYAREGRSDLKFHYVHNSGDQKRIDPSKTNIIDVYVLSASYNTNYRSWISGNVSTEPLPPTSQELELNYSNYLNTIKSISDEIIFHPVKFKNLFGDKANLPLQAVFKAARNPDILTNENTLKVKIITAINSFFDIQNWEFGQSFYFSELATYVMNELTPYITNFVIVPKVNGKFGNLYEISCLPNEILLNVATIDNIEIIDVLSLTQLQPSILQTN